MSEENRIDIEIKDKVSPNIRKKFLQLAKAVKTLDTGITKLKKNMKALDATSINKLSTASARLTNAATKANTARAKLKDQTLKLTTAEQKLRKATAQATLAERKRTNAMLTALKIKAQTASTNLRAEATALRLAKANNKVAKSTSNATSKFIPFIRTLMAFGGVGVSLGGIVKAGDAYTELQNKLRNVIDTEKELEEVTKRVFDIANKTRTPVQETAQAFQRFDLALKDLGASQEESLRLTETVNKALILSGSTSTEAGSALLQLSQAFNKGKLDGDEFRSVMELLTPASEAIADEMKVVRGELLKLAPQGKITAEVMRAAFANVADKIDAKFAKTIPTISQSFVVLKNKATEFFGKIDKWLGASAAIAKAILWIGDNIKLLGVALGTLVAALLLAFGPAMLATIGGFLTKVAFGINKLFLVMAANPIGLLIVGIAAATLAFMAFKDEIKLSEDGVISLGNASEATFQLMGESAKPILDWFEGAFNSLFETINSKFESFPGSVSGAFSEVAGFVKTWANSNIAIFVAMFNTIKNVWGLLPGAIGDVLTMVLNLHITSVEKTVNSTLKGLRKLLDLSNQAAEYLGLNPIFDVDAQVDLSRFKGEITGASTELAGIAKREFTNAFNTDFVGNVVTAIGTRAREIAASQGVDLRGEGERKIPALPTAAGDAAEQIKKTEDVVTPRNVELTKMQQLLAAATGEFGEFLSGTPEMIDANSDRLGEYYAKVASLRKQDLISEQSAQTAKVKIWLAQHNERVDQARFFFSTLEGLQNSKNKKMQQVAQAAAVAGALVDTYKAATGAYAAMASVPYVGPYLGAAAAAAAVAAGMANVKQIRAQGYEQGGFTGNIGRKEVAGVVHGREFVMDASTTSRIGVANLESLRSGAARVQKADYGNSTAAGEPGDSRQANSGSGTPHSQNMRIVNVLDPEVVSNFLQSSEGERVILNTISNNSDTVAFAVANA